MFYKIVVNGFAVFFFVMFSDKSMLNSSRILSFLFIFFSGGGK